MLTVLLYDIAEIRYTHCCNQDDRHFKTWFIKCYFMLQMHAFSLE